MAEIDGQIRRVAINSQPGSDISVLAYAIHNVISVVAKLDRS